MVTIIISSLLDKLWLKYKCFSFLAATEFKNKFEECAKAVDKSASDKDNSDKLANDLSALKVKDENENTEKSDEAASKQPDNVSASVTNDKDDEKDTDKTSESKEADKDWFFLFLFYSNFLPREVKMTLYFAYYRL